MNDPTFVDILNTHCDLMYIIFCLDLSNSLSSFNKLIESLVRAEFEDNIYIVFIFEVMTEANNVWRFERSMNFDFRI